MAKRITVVISQGQSANPVKRALEENLVAALLMERGLEVTVIPHLYDLAPDGTGMLCLQGISGDFILLSWLYPRAARWVLDRNGIRGKEGQSLIVAEADEDEDEEDDSGSPNSNGAHAETSAEAPPAGDDKVVSQRAATNRLIYCLDLRLRSAAEPFVEEIRRIAKEASASVVSLGNFIQGTPKPEQMARYLNPGPGNVASVSLGNVFGITNGHASPAPSGSTHSASPNSAAPTAATNGAAPNAPNGASAHVEPANAAQAGSSTLPGSLSGELAAASSALAASPAELIRVEENTQRRWYPVIDFSRCTNCMECLDFCLFGVYGVDRSETILVEQPDNCRKGCPACSRVCPENAIIFPQHKSEAIAGGETGVTGGFKIDLSQLFGGSDALTTAVQERDSELVAAGRDAVGMEIGIPKRQNGKSDGPKDDLDNLMDQLDALDL